MHTILAWSNKKQDGPRGNIRMFLPGKDFADLSPTGTFLANGLTKAGAAVPTLPTLPELLTLEGTLGFAVKRPETLGTWAILFLPSDVGGAEPLKTWATRFDASVDKDPDEDVDEDVDEGVDDGAFASACSFNSFIFLKRSIIIIPGLSLAGGRAIGWLAGDRSSDVAAWAIRCFLVGMTSSAAGGTSSDFLRFFSSDTWTGSGLYSFKRIDDID